MISDQSVQKFRSFTLQFVIYGIKTESPTQVNARNSESNALMTSLSVVIAEFAIQSFVDIIDVTQQYAQKK